MNYTVDDSGNITSAEPVAIDSVITKIQTFTDNIAQATASIATWQAEIDALNAVLVQVAQAPDTDPTTLQTVQAISAVANQLQSVKQITQQTNVSGTN